MESCIFCRILEGRAPASIVYEDETCVAFMDIRPVNPGHVLVIPRTHASCPSELTEDIGASMFKVGMRIAEALKRSGLLCEGVNFYLADGEAAGQEVDHVHLHVFPRFAGDGFGLRFGPDYGKASSRSSLDEAARKIKDAMPRT